MGVGEGPGYWEDKRGVPFVGATGDELDRHLEANDLGDRYQIFLSNIYRQYGGQDYEWTATDLERDEPDLLRELAEVRPSTIFTMGRHATRYLLGDVDMEGCHSIPWVLPPSDKWPFLDNTVVLPVYHPAAGMRNSDISPYVVGGFQALAAYLRGEVQARRLFDDPYEGKEVYEEITSEFQLDASLATWKGQPLGLDTEGWPGSPWSLQYSFEPGRGYCISARSRELLGRFAGWCRRHRPRFVFHSALHDLTIMRELQCESVGEFDDTMIMAYLLQLEPKGLKHASLRHCGMRMMEYTDLVGDKQDELMVQYATWIQMLEEADYVSAQEHEFERLVTTPYVNKKGKVVNGRNLRSLPKLPRSPLSRAITRILRSKRPYALWLDQIEDIHVAGYHRLGPVPRASLDYVRPDRAIRYACRDADATLRLAAELTRRVDQMGLRSSYELELRTYPLIDRMAQIGLKPDCAVFAELSGLLGTHIAGLQAAIDEYTGQPGLNANSGDQVAAYLFGTLGLDEIKMTSGGRGSTNDKILEALEHEHPEYPVISTFREYRETYKLKHTFVDQIPDFVKAYPHDGRIHTTFRTTTIPTGRLAASNPNILAQPEHGKFAPEFKRGWVAEKGHVICAWDQSQIELRGLAHLSQDPLMLAVFRGERRNPDGSLVDLHAALAERIFGVPPALQDKHRHRLPAKAINFGIPMGMTCHGLSVELRKNGVEADEDTAQRWLDDTLGLYTGVRTYMDSRIAEARRYGYVRCLSGRIRYIGGINSRDERIRAEAERFAFSTPIQESAQFIMKQAEASVWEDIIVPWQQQGVWIEPLLQQHDSLKVEVQEDLAQELNTLMTCAMTSMPRSLSVPLAVEGEWGWNMGPVTIKERPDWHNPQGMRGF